MIPRSLRPAVVLGAVLLLGGVFPAGAAQNRDAGKPALTAGELKLAFRYLWTDRMFRTRNFLLAANQGEGKDAKAAEEKVGANGRAIADSLAPYYGRESANEFSKLLEARFEAVRQYMTATLNINGLGQKSAADRFRMSANRMAAFLSSANPGNWRHDTIARLLVLLSADQMAQIDMIARKDFVSEAEIRSDLEKKAHTLAGMLADGIVKQFPDRF